MNIVVLGGGPAEKIAEVLSTNFDSASLFVFEDINRFMMETTSHSIAVHRIILMQDAVSNVSEDSLYQFVEFTAVNFPAARIITMCKDKEWVHTLGDSLVSPYSVHLLAPKLMNNAILDMASLDTKKIASKYSKMVYVKKIESITTIVDDTHNQDTEVGEPNQSQGKGKKKGLFGGLFGGKKKQQGPMIKEGGLKPIGQGFGVEELPEIPSQMDEEQGQEGGNFSLFGEGLDLGLGVEVGNNDNAQTGTIFDLPYDSEENESFSDDSDMGQEDSSSQDFDSEPVWPDDDDTEEDFSEKQEDLVEGQEDLAEEQEDFVEEEEVDDEEEEFGFDGSEESNIWGNPLDDLQDNQENIDINLDVPDLTQFKEDIQSAKISKGAKVNIPNLDKQEVPMEEVEDTETDLFSDSLEDMLAEYEEEKNKPRIVEKVIERVVTVHSGVQSRNKNGVRILVVTGDRKVGATRFSLNLANYYGVNENTLYVDFDRKRKGSVHYLGVEELINTPTHIQNGLLHYKTANVLTNVTYLYEKGGFSALVSMYGEEVDDESMKRVQRLLASQNVYTTIIIDCPLENLYLLEDILYTSNVLICVEDNKLGVLNTLIGINDMVTDEKLLTPLYNNSSFVVGKQCNVDKFLSSLHYISDIFGLDETSTDWGKLQVSGVIKQVKELAGRMG